MSDFNQVVNTGVNTPVQPTATPNLQSLSALGVKVYQPESIWEENQVIAGFEAIRIDGVVYSFMNNSFGQSLKVKTPEGQSFIPIDDKHQLDASKTWCFKQMVAKQDWTAYKHKVSKELKTPEELQALVNTQQATVDQYEMISVAKGQVKVMAVPVE